MTSSARPSPPVSRETQARLDIIEAQLIRWQPRINLVASGTMHDIKTRHVDDSLQLCALAPNAIRWIDLGSGGGFPGLVAAAVLAARQESQLVLVESNAKKCAFLRETARLASLPVTVVCARIETLDPDAWKPFDVVSARALSPLPQLIAFAEPFLRRGAVGLFPKGQGVDEEIAAALLSWRFEFDLIQSQTELNARIVRVTSASRLDAP